MSYKRVNFVKRRKAVGMTQRQLAEAIGVTSRTVQSWELGEYIPTLNPLQTLTLCRLLNCSVEDLARDFHPDAFGADVAAESPN
jgi:DNA-binding XRE family transcriptional regulator